jgi:alkanesulfonate monooxygenase SsuD/methylene tetrahydromethanopterin reductase-like flavin-dependent oxidoreductase (luciferase family)
MALERRRRPEVVTGLMFGLNVSTSAEPGADPLAQAKRAEDLGFDFVSANDHPAGTDPTFELWTMLGWIAAGTSKIRVASRVLGVPYRPPAMVAKMAESLDRLSGGRLILGMGGGYSDEEFRAFGLGVPSPRDKVDGLGEAIRIIHGLWTEPTFTFEGRLYRTHDAQLQPKPEHRIPIWLGTLGPRALEVTGRLADGWIPSFALAPPDRITGMRDRIMSAALAAGRDPDELVCVYNMEIDLGDRPDPSQSIVSGPADQVAEQLLGFVSLGFAAFNFIPRGHEHDVQIERLAREVIPAVRAGA